MKRLSIAIALFGLLGWALPHVVSAQQIYPGAQCIGTGGWDTLVNLTANRPPATYICANSWTADAGFVVSNGTSWATPGGTGSVTSVALSAPSVFSVSGSPVTTSGTLGLSFASGQTANSFLATPNGSSGALGLRALLAADLPGTITSSTSGNAATATALAASPTQCSAGQFSTGITATGSANCATGNSGTVTSATVTVPAPLSASGCTITASGTCAISWASGQPANQFLASPSGVAGAVSLRTLASSDLPSSIASNTSGNAATATALASTPTQCTGGQFSTGVTTAGNANCANLPSGPSGTVTSVGLTVPSWLAVGGSPITSSGTLAVTAAGSQTANLFVATPNGATGAVALRAIVNTDLPATLSANTTGNAATATALAATPSQCSGQFATGITANGNANCASQAVPPVGSPTSRALSLATAYQATTTTKAASVNINITSTASISLSGGSTNSATVYIGSTNAVASGTGTPICSYSNSNTGTLTVGLNLSTISAVPCHFDLPIGWFFAILQSSGTVTITSAYDQSIG